METRPPPFDSVHEAFLPGKTTTPEPRVITSVLARLYREAFPGGMGSTLDT